MNPTDEEFFRACYDVGHPRESYSNFIAGIERLREKENDEDTTEMQLRRNGNVILRN